MEAQEDTPKKQSIKPKTKKECSQDLLERLQNMRLKAAEARKNKALLNEKSRLYKQEKHKKLEEDAKKYDELMKAKEMQKPIEPEPLHVAAAAEPAQKKKAKKKVIIEEVSEDEDESEEEVIIKRKIKKPQAPKSSRKKEEIGRLTRNAINERIREKINQERINYVTDLLKPTYY